MNSNHDDLLQRLGTLKEEFSELGSWLCEAGQELQRHGALPPPNLPEELAAARLNFLNFRLELFTWIQSLRLPAKTSLQEPDSLQNCEALLQATVTAVRERDRAEAARQKSLEVLRRATLLASRKPADFPPLQTLLEAVRELQHGIAEAEVFNLPAECQALAEGTHPIAVLLTLVENQKEAQNNLWIALLKNVQPLLDAGLLEAVKNGDLLLQPGTIPDLPQEKDKAASVKAPVSARRKALAKPAAPAQTTPDSFQPVTDEEAPASGSEHSMKPAPAPEKSAAELATAIVNTPASQRGPLVQNLIWQLLFDDQLNLAYHLAHIAEHQDFVLQPRLPTWLMRALALSRHLLDADGEIARLLQEDFAQCHDVFNASAQAPEWRRATHLLLAAACLRPALLHPAAASLPLQMVHLEDLEQFSSYIQLLVRCGIEQRSLPRRRFEKIDNHGHIPSETNKQARKLEKEQYLKKNGQDIGSRRNAVLSELQAAGQGDPSLPLAASLWVCRRAVENVGALLDLETELPLDEPDPKSLFHTGLGKALAPAHESGQPPAAGANAMLESLMNFLAGKETAIIPLKPSAPSATHDPIPVLARQDQAAPAVVPAHMSRRDQESAEEGGNNDGIFDDFFPKTFRLLWDYLEPPATKNKPRVFEIVNNIRKYAKGLAKNGAIGPVRIPAAHAEEVAELLEIWFRAEKARRISEGAVQQLWNSLGFDTIKITKHTLGNRTWFDVRTSPLLDKARGDVPAYGAGANGFYRIICVWPHTNTSPNNEMEMIHHTEDMPAGTAVVFLYFGGLAEQQRRHLGKLCHEHRRTFIVLDTLLLLYVHSRPKAHRLPAIFQCTLPFTFIETEKPKTKSF